MKRKLRTSLSNRNTTIAGMNLMLCFFCLIISYNTIAQAKRDIVTQSIQWTSFNSNIKLSKKVGVALDGQFRFAEFGTMQNQLRAGVEFYLSKRIAVIPVHYSYIWNALYGKQPASYVNNEHRIGQQISYKHGFTRVSLSHRIRFEERFLQVHSKNANDVVVDQGYTNRQFRIRYRAMLNVPINRQKMEAKTVYICVWDEIFMSRGKSVTYNDPDQNRIFIGPGYQFTKDIAFQGGFIYQALVKSNGSKQENNLGVLLQLNYNFDLTKKENK